MIQLPRSQLYESLGRSCLMSNGMPIDKQEKIQYQLKYSFFHMLHTYSVSQGQNKYIPQIFLIQVQELTGCGLGDSQQWCRVFSYCELQKKKKL